MRKSCEYRVLDCTGYVGPEEQRDQYVCWAFHLQEWQQGRNGEACVLQALAYDLVNACVFQVHWEPEDDGFLKGAFLRRFSHHPSHQQTNGKLIQAIGPEEGRLNNLWERVQEEQERIPLHLCPSASNQYHITSLPYPCALLEHPFEHQYEDAENMEWVLLFALGEHQLQYIALDFEQESLSYFLMDSGSVGDPEPVILITNEQDKPLAVCTPHWHTVMERSKWEGARASILEWK